MFDLSQEKQISDKYCLLSIATNFTWLENKNEMDTF